MDPQPIHVSQRMPSTILNVTQGAVLLLLVSSTSHIRSHCSPQQSQSWFLAVFAVADWNVILCTGVLLNAQLLRIAPLRACQGQLCDHCQGVIAGGRAGPQATPPDGAVENRGGVKPGCVHIGKALLMLRETLIQLRVGHTPAHATLTCVSISPKCAMMVAQKLYESRHITHMCTDSTGIERQKLKFHWHGKLAWLMKPAMSMTHTNT